MGLWVFKRFLGWLGKLWAGVKTGLFADGVLWFAWR